MEARLQRERLYDLLQAHACNNQYFEVFALASATPNKKAILITVDCLRADHLSCYGYERRTSPLIDALADKGIRFENAFANGPNTPPCFRSILTSGYPFEFPRPEPFAPNVELLSEVLKRKGVRTAAIHSNPYLSAFYGFNRGWSYFKDFLSRNYISQYSKTKRSFGHLVRKHLPEMIREWWDSAATFSGLSRNPAENAEIITEDAMCWLRENKDLPSFLWIHYMDLHEPYFLADTKVKRQFSRKLSRLSQVRLNRIWTRALQGKPQNQKGENTQDIINVYDDKVRYVDENLSKFFGFLSQEGLADCTFTVLCADHGQELLDHESVGHGGDNFFDEILHIPLILLGPGLQSQVNRKLVSQLDITPTILDFYGIKTSKDYRSHSLLSTHANSLVITEGFPQRGPTYAIRTKKWKYICTRKKRRQLYNLDEDIGEMENLAQLEKTKAKEFQAIVERHIIWEAKLRTERRTVSEKEKTLSRTKKLKTRLHTLHRRSCNKVNI